jgi:AcrR family transcriptional regulator
MDMTGRGPTQGVSMPKLLSDSVKATSSIGHRRLIAKGDATPHYTERSAVLRKAAAELFKEQGFRETSLDDIAQRAGVDRSSIYYYVSNKRELFLEVVGKTLDVMAKKIDDIANTDSDPAEKLERALVALMDNYSSNYPSLYVFIQEKMTKVSKSAQIRSLTKLESKIENALIRIIQDGVDQGRIRSDIVPKIAAYGLLGMVNWTHRWFRPDGPMTSEQIGRTFAAMILEGVQVNGPRSTSMMTKRGGHT